MEKIKDFAIGASVWALMLGVPIGIVALGSDSSSTNRANHSALPEPVCSTDSIPFETVEQETDELVVGDSERITSGVEGERTICTRDNVEISDDITTEPVNEVIRIGTYEPYEEPEAYYASCPITTCNDGTCSSSTGRGTCSWHGGVAY